MEGQAEVTRGTRRIGLFLIVCGVIGIVTGLLPLVLNVLRLLGCTFGLSRESMANHGVEAMGLSVPWAVLSCWDGAFLGSLLVAAGLGWRRGWRWAPLVTFLYAVHGTMITGLDLLIFATYARPGRMRDRMLVLDGLACALAVTVLVAMVVWWWRRRAARRQG
jgi:hypothetical protein